MNNLIIVDTREKGHKSILKYFDEHNIDYITSKLDYGDYKLGEALCPTLWCGGCAKGVGR